MEHEILEKEIGKEGLLELDFKDGKLLFKVGVDTKGVDAGLYATVDGDYFMDKLAEAIPGTLDDAIIATIKVAMKA